MLSSSARSAQTRLRAFPLGSRFIFGITTSRRRVPVDGSCKRRIRRPLFEGGVERREGSGGTAGSGGTKRKRRGARKKRKRGMRVEAGLEGKQGEKGGGGVGGETGRKGWRRGWGGNGAKGRGGGEGVWLVSVRASARLRVVVDQKVISMMRAAWSRTSSAASCSTTCPTRVRRLVLMAVASGGPKAGLALKADARAKAPLSPTSL